MRRSLPGVEGTRRFHFIYVQVAADREALLAHHYVPGPGDHTGDRPMRIIWRLDHELPADLFLAARVAAG
ncbi:hypothetical protein BH23ACT12_BH23ACT12_04800 [soil metagenome]